MRELKFRAWNTTAKRMIYDIQQEPADSTQYSFADYLEDKNNNVVMQFIGLLDKYGKEVYKDDILCVEASATGTVIDGRGGYLIAFADGHRLSFEDVASEYIEVVGNINETEKEQG